MISARSSFNAASAPVLAHSRRRSALTLRDDLATIPPQKAEGFYQSLEPFILKYPFHSVDSFIGQPSHVGRLFHHLAVVSAEPMLLCQLACHGSG